MRPSLQQAVIITTLGKQRNILLTVFGKTVHSIRKGTNHIKTHYFQYSQWVSKSQGDTSSLSWAANSLIVQYNTRIAMFAQLQYYRFIYVDFPQDSLPIPESFE